VISVPTQKQKRIPTADAERLKYRTLCAILDKRIKDGANLGRRKYQRANDNTESLQQARSAAFVHLYLEVTKNIFDFDKRDHFVTDGANDGGVDAYFINKEDKSIELIQAKFRGTSDNFSSKYIDIEEIAAIELDRLTRGRKTSSTGQRYNGKIIRMLQEIGATDHISSYKYKLVILANIKPAASPVIEKIFPNREVDVWDFSRTYSDIVLPVLKAEQYYDERLNVVLNIAEKNRDARLTSAINTQYGPCAVTIVLVPTFEIARATGRYKNSLLQFNPRAYLGKLRPNVAIRSSICEASSGEFALLNNGLTIVVDGISFSTEIGREDEAEMSLLNPQIVNGGQTALTLSKVLEDFGDERAGPMFDGKEVITKVIRLPTLDAESRRALITRISEATNTQSSVISADRLADSTIQRAIMDRLFLLTGLVFEYRTGELWEASADGIVASDQFIDRVLLRRLCLLVDGSYSVAVQRSLMKKGRNQFSKIPSDRTLERVALAWSMYRLLYKGRKGGWRGTQLVTLAKTAACLLVYEHLGTQGRDVSAKECVQRVEHHWRGLIEWARGNVSKFRMQTINRQTGEVRTIFSVDSWVESERYPSDVKQYLIPAIEAPVDQDLFNKMSLSD
jgi:AIPR protein